MGTLVKLFYYELACKGHTLKLRVFFTLIFAVLLIYELFSNSVCLYSYNAL